MSLRAPQGASLARQAVGTGQLRRLPYSKHERSAVMARTNKRSAESRVETLRRKTARKHKYYVRPLSADLIGV